MLQEAPLKDLVLVSYADDYEWVYNQAEVVWARSRDSLHDRELIQYFQGRVVWRLNADADSPKLTLQKPEQPSLAVTSW